MVKQQVWIPVALFAALIAVVAVWRTAREAVQGLTGISLQTQASPPLSGWNGALLASGELPPFEPVGRNAVAPIDFDPLLDGGTVHADAVDVPVPLQPSAGGSQPMPGALPAPTAAQPIDVHTAAAERQLDELIDRELSSLPEQQRSVRREVLHGLPAKEAEEILQIWKLTARRDSPPTLPTWSPGTEPRSLSPASASIALPSHVAECVRRNLAHLDTPGYRRREVRQTAIDEGSVRESATRTDLTPGELRHTGNPLHLAIEGAGFFCLRKGESVAYTRSGEFDLTSGMELCQRRTDGLWLVDPPLTMPSDAVQIVVGENGGVSAYNRRQPPQLQNCGQVMLTLFVNPQHLSPLDGDLLSASVGSGGPHPTAPGESGAGRLRQGCLEQSNATIATETATLEIWEQQRRLLQQIAPDSHRTTVLQ